MLVFPNVFNKKPTNQGFPLKCGSMPYSYFTAADYNPSAADPRKVFENRKGAENAAIELICQVGNRRLKLYGKL